MSRQDRKPPRCQSKPAITATRITLATLASLALTTTPAPARSAPIALLNPDGSGRLLADQGSPEWKACKPDLSVCSPFAAGSDISTDGAAPETVFWGGEDQLSPVWYGNVFAVTQPSVTGTLRANELVTPVPGQWHGGWDGDHDSTQLAACTSPTGEDCITLTHTHYPGGCSDGAAVIDPAFSGRYLRVADQRLGAGPIAEPAYAVSSPYGGGVWPADTLTSVAMVGQITAATGDREVECGPPPLARASISKRGVATVRCELLACRTALIAKRGRRRARVVRKLPAVPFRLSAKNLPRLRLRPRSLVRLGSGRTRMIVKVNGLQIAQRTVRLRTMRHLSPTSRR
jgi:hypothetical protein